MTVLSGTLSELNRSIILGMEIFCFLKDMGLARLFTAKTVIYADEALAKACIINTILCTNFQESEILKYFTTKEELEPLAENCTKVYVWHTRTQKPALLNPKKLKLKHPPIPDSHIEV